MTTIFLPDGMPSTIHRLPKNSAGYPIPWFVQRSPDDKGNPDFRVMDGSKLIQAINDSLCWVCGQRMPKTYQTFVVGPMCLVNHTSAEPPAHWRCAQWSAIACPFLSNPKKVRREANMPEGSHGAGGVMIARNPGVTACLMMASRRDWKPVRVPNGLIITFGEPAEVRWWAEGRPATRAEVEESIRTGEPILREMAEAGGPSDVAELDRLLEAVRVWLPEAE